MNIKSKISNNVSILANEFELFLLKCKNKYNHVPSSCMIKWHISMFLSVPYMSIRLVHMQYWYDEITFISISDPKPIDGVLVGWATSVVYDPTSIKKCR
jgi:hypothetical protein